MKTFIEIFFLVKRYSDKVNSVQHDQVHWIFLYPTLAFKNLKLSVELFKMMVESSLGLLQIIELNNLFYLKNELK